MVLWAGRHRRDLWTPLYDLYRTRIERFMPCSERFVRVARAADGSVRRAEEGAALLGALPSGATVVALDGGGELLTSRELADFLRRRIEEQSGAIAFLLGSDLGLAPELLESADLRLAFGRMTLPHELARLVLFEQLYRALSIMNGIKYHRDRF